MRFAVTINKIYILMHFNEIKKLIWLQIIQ